MSAPPSSGRGAHKKRIPDLNVGTLGQGYSVKENFTENQDLEIGRS